MGLYSWAFRPEGTVVPNRDWFRSQSIYSQVKYRQSDANSSMALGKHDVSIASENRTNLTHFQIAQSFDSQSNQFGPSFDSQSN